MSNQVRCDGCGLVQMEVAGYCVSTMMPKDHWEGWWSVDTMGMLDREHYDFCSLKCLVSWTTQREADLNSFASWIAKRKQPEREEALSDKQKTMWDGLNEAGKKELLFKLISQGMDVIAGLFADYAGDLPDGFTWVGEKDA